MALDTPQLFRVKALDEVEWTAIGCTKKALDVARQACIQCKRKWFLGPAGVSGSSRIWGHHLGRFSLLGHSVLLWRADQVLVVFASCEQ